MRHSCEDVQLLISKYIDAEATPAEREIVDLHVVACFECARKMTEYMEIAAIFAEAPMRAPQPELRAGLFREIGSMKEEARRKETLIKQRKWYRWSPPASPGANRIPVGRRFSWGRLWDVASPVAAASMAVLAIIAVIFMNGPKAPDSNRDEQTIANYPYYPAVSTIPATVVYPVSINTGSDSSVYDHVPSIKTSLASPPPIASESVPVQSTATIGEDIALELEQATPVLEAEDAWHQLRDPAYGYLVSYPANWWTQSRGNTRYFYPWTQGGTEYAPYRIEMRVDSNVQGLDAISGNQALLDGNGRLEGREGDALWLRSSGDDIANVTDVIYAFDPNFIYTLRLIVPKESPLGDFETRWSKAQDLFSRMSHNVSVGGQAGRVLFLNGGDLWSVSVTGPANPLALWKGYNSRWTRQFVLSPDGRTVAFSTTDVSLDPWANELNLAHIDAVGNKARLVLSGAEIHDIAWYSDRELLAIADIGESGLGIYRLTLDAKGSVAPPDLLVELGEEMTGARGLSVSPDRQLISFLAPLGDIKSTNIYAVRPDGSNLVKLVGHEDAVSPLQPNGLNIPAEQQAIKSYVWADGKLEPGQGGYAYSLLYTCGNSASPTLYRGGFLYGAPQQWNAPLLDPAWLNKPDAAAVQIVHVAYSHTGKVALSGFYSLRNLKVESLAGLWTADFNGGVLSNVQPLPTPDSSRGVADLQWSPDGTSIIYREMIPSSEADFASRYDGRSPFSIVKLNVSTGQKTILYNALGR